MKNIYIIGCLIALAAMGMSCSATLQKRYDQRHGTTTTTDENDRYNDTRYGDTRYGDTRYGNTQQSQSTYKKDYGKIADDNAGSTGIVSDNADYNYKLLSQYAEMDKLGEVVLYELDILESRWNVLLEEYKNSKPSGKQVISNELDRVSDDRIVLYKAYTNIYRNGKTNWTVVKRDVENTLRSVRRVTEK